MNLEPQHLQNYGEHAVSHWSKIGRLQPCRSMQSSSLPGTLFLISVMFYCVYITKALSSSFVSQTFINLRLTWAQPGILSGAQHYSLGYH